MGRSPCCEKVGLKKGPWTPEEDQKLLLYIQEHGHGSWRALPPKAGLQRCGKSCRLRWTNYLRPDIKRGKFSLQEEQTIIQLHALLGNRWSAIAGHLPKRTDNEIKNYWNTHLKKRLVKMGIDPTTHKPKNHALGCSQPRDVANLSHMAQWESARLEAEARIVRESKLLVCNNSSYSSHQFINAAAPPPPLPPPPCLDILKVWQGTWARSANSTRKDVVLAATFFASNGNLESPTSILNFSDTTIAAAAAAPNVVGSINEGAFAADSVNYVGNPCPCTVGKANNGGYQDEKTKDIMGNSLQLHDNHIAYPNISTTNYSSNLGDSLKFPSFLDGFADANNLGDSHHVMFEDNKVNYWSNILNVANSPMGSPVF